MSLTQTPVYPCNKGIPGNVQNRGWHRFEANASGVAVCTLCGEKPAGRTLGERMRTA